MNKKGQALVEYILIIALMSIIIISLVKYFGGYLKDSVTKTSCNIIIFYFSIVNWECLISSPSFHSISNSYFLHPSDHIKKPENKFYKLLSGYCVIKKNFKSS